MYFLSLSVTLLVIIASVHLLAKVRNENLGILSKLLAYFVLLTAVLVLACQLFRGVDKMERGGKKCKKECKMMMGEEGEHHMMMKKFRHGDGKESGCIMKMREECTCPMGENGKCKEGKDCKMECCNDSLAKGECKMHKEVEVIIKEGDKE